MGILYKFHETYHLPINYTSLRAAEHYVTVESRYATPQPAEPIFPHLNDKYSRPPPISKLSHQVSTMSSAPIPCVAMGKDRQHAEGVASHLAQHNFSVVAVLDESLFSPANVGIISRALLPWPKVLLIGGAFSD